MPEAPAPNSASTVSDAHDHPHHSGVEGLKKMSVTAGLGSGDYAAVNTLAVVSLAAAVLGGLAFLEDFLLFIPVVAIVCSVVALRQIYSSNGTQTGRGLSAAAILISLLVIGFVGGNKLLRYLHNKPDQEKIVAQIAELDKAMANRDYAGAYRLTSPGFQKRFTEKEFVEPFVAFEGIAEFGGVSGISWNQTPMEFADDKQSGVRMAYIGGRFHFRKNQTPTHVPLGFLKVGDNWYLNDLPSLFKGTGKEGAGPGM